MSGKKPTIYLDHAATSKVREQALAAMLPYLSEEFGNPSSLHGPGLSAKKAMQQARARMAELLGCETNEILFTSGGTEADNWAITGYLFGNPNAGKHIITSAVEHPAVLKTCEFMKRFGYEVTVLPVTGDGTVTPESVQRALRSDTALITIQTANNEIGTIQPIEEIGRIAAEWGVAFHTDAVQAVGTLPMSLRDMPVTMLSASGHKFGGPKGIGFLYVKNGTKLEPLLHGGPQEKRMRAGTENVPGIVSMAAALSEALKQDYEAVRKLRDYTEQRIVSEIPDVRINGAGENRLPGSLSVSIGGVEAVSVLVFLDLAGIAASGGSACTSAENKPSEVLRAIGAEEPYLSGTVRFTFSEENVKEEADFTVDVLKETVNKLRGSR